MKRWGIGGLAALLLFSAIGLVTKVATDWSRSAAWTKLERQLRDNLAKEQAFAEITTDARDTLVGLDVLLSASFPSTGPEDSKPQPIEGLANKYWLSGDEIDQRLKTTDGPLLLAEMTEHLRDIPHCPIYVVDTPLAPLIRKLYENLDYLSSRPSKPAVELGANPRRLNAHGSAEAFLDRVNRRWLPPGSRILETAEELVAETSVANALKFREAVNQLAVRVSRFIEETPASAKGDFPRPPKAKYPSRPRLLNSRNARPRMTPPMLWNDEADESRGRTIGSTTVLIRTVSFNRRKTAKIYRINTRIDSVDTWTDDFRDGHREAFERHGLKPTHVELDPIESKVSSTRYRFHFLGSDAGGVLLLIGKPANNRGFAFALSITGDVGQFDGPYDRFPRLQRVFTRFDRLAHGWPAVQATRQNQGGPGERKAGTSKSSERTTAAPTTEPSTTDSTRREYDEIQTALSSDEQLPQAPDRLAAILRTKHPKWEGVPRELAGALEKQFFRHLRHVPNIGPGAGSSTLRSVAFQRAILRQAERMLGKLDQPEYEVFELVILAHAYRALGDRQDADERLQRALSRIARIDESNAALAAAGEVTGWLYNWSEDDPARRAITLGAATIPTATKADRVYSYAYFSAMAVLLDDRETAEALFERIPPPHSLTGPISGQVLHYAIVGDFDTMRSDVRRVAAPYNSLIAMAAAAGGQEAECIAAKRRVLAALSKRHRSRDLAHLATADVYLGDFDLARSRLRGLPDEFQVYVYCDLAHEYALAGNLEEAHAALLKTHLKPRAVLPCHLIPKQMARQSDSLFKVYHYCVTLGSSTARLVALCGLVAGLNDDVPTRQRRVMPFS